MRRGAPRTGAPLVRSTSVPDGYFLFRLTAFFFSVFLIVLVAAATRAAQPCGTPATLRHRQRVEAIRELDGNILETPDTDIGRDGGHLERRQLGRTQL